MLSILIPTYHYNAYPLALELEKQALKLGITFELICMDDGSFSHLNIENQNINTLMNCNFIEVRKNNGSRATRQKLAEIAQYEWLLFLDADTMPVSTNFLKLFKNELPKKALTIFGGIAYRNSKPEPSKSLRWYYGKAREQKSVAIRKQKTYQSIISGCFCIKKNLFIKINNSITRDAYGLDILFAKELKKHQILVKHIDNPVYHLGLETNALYLEKSKKALETLYVLMNAKKIEKSQTALLKVYTLLNFLGIANIFGEFIFKFNKKIEDQLTSGSPKLWLFDLYRLGYFCRIHKSI